MCNYKKKKKTGKTHYYIIYELYQKVHYGIMKLEIKETTLGDLPGKGITSAADSRRKYGNRLYNHSFRNAPSSSYSMEIFYDFRSEKLN